MRPRSALVLAGSVLVLAGRAPVLAGRAPVLAPRALARASCVWRPRRDPCILLLMPRAPLAALDRRRRCPGGVGPFGRRASTSRRWWAPLAAVATLLWHPATASALGAPSDREALLVLATELESGKGPGGSAAVYARAFTGYSLVAEGLSDPGFAPAAASHVERLAAQVARLETKFDTGVVTVAGRGLSSSAVLRGHLALLLVGRRALGGMSEKDLALEEALVHGLAADVHADRNHLLPSYGRRTWPADNEVVLAALRAHVALAGHDEAIEPAAAELAASLTAITRGGLPASEVEPDSLARKDVPRGCALSWSVAFRGLHDPAAAEALWEVVRADYLVHVGPAVGVREWPPGVERKADADSGPIFRGVGAAASAFALPATRLAAAPADHLALRGSAQLAGLATVEAKRGTEQLPRAIALWGRLARPLPASKAAAAPR